MRETTGNAAVAAADYPRPPRPPTEPRRRTPATSSVRASGVALSLGGPCGCARRRNYANSLLQAQILLLLSRDNAIRLCVTSSVKRNKKAKQPGPVRLTGDAAKAVVGWSELTGWSLTKVASELIIWASGQEGASVIDRLNREAEATNLIRIAQRKAAELRKGGVKP